MSAYVYILANHGHRSLYVGVTSDLERRIAEHKAHTFPGFSARYNIVNLVWFSECADIRTAIEQEKKIKNRGRVWKNKLIESANPEWLDLSEALRDPAIPLRGPQDDGSGD